MRPVRGTIALAAAGICHALAGEGCLLAYDFEEYGSGGAVSASAGASTGNTAASGTGGAGGADMPADFEPCTEEGVSYVVLPATWTDVRVTQFGRGFVAAPRDVLEYLVLPEPVAEGWQPSLIPRVEATDGLLALFRLTVEENDERVVGVRSDGEDVKLKAFDLGSGSDTLRADFASARQFAGEVPSLLVTSTVDTPNGEATRAQMLTPY